MDRGLDGVDARLRGGFVVEGVGAVLNHVGLKAS